MKTIYEQFDKAFSKISAYAILDATGSHIGKAAFKLGNTGRVTCYFQVMGSRMVKGWADGYGYDKINAAAQDAVSKLTDNTPTITTIMQALAKDTGYDWKRELENSGFKVISVI